MNDVIGISLFMPDLVHLTQCPPVSLVLLQSALSLMNE